MRISFTEKLLWSTYKAAKISIKLLNKWCEGGAYGLKGAQKMIEFLTFTDFSKLTKIEQKKLGKERFNKTINYLQYKGYLHIKKIKNKKAVLLTSMGADKLLNIYYKIEGRPRRRDGKWQMVIFDIPEKIRKKRDYFRDGLKRLGYEKLQQSIWVCPYDVFNETKELIKYFNLESFVDLLLTEEVIIK